MKSSKLESSGKKVIFNITNNLEVIDHDESIEIWLSKPLSGQNKLTINDLKDHIKYHILYLFSILKVNDNHSIEESYNQGHESINILITRYDKSDHYEVQINLIRDHSEEKYYYTQKSNSLSSKKVEATIQHISNQNEIVKEEVLNQLKSIKRQLSFREDQLRKSIQDFHLLLENNTQASVMIDHLYTLVEFNGNARELLKYMFGKEIQKNLVFTHLFPEDDIAKFKSNFLTVLKGEKEHHTVNFSYQDKYGEVKTYQFDFHAVKRFNQTLNAVTILITDVTDQLLEEKVRTINLQLMKVAMDPKNTREEIATYFINRFEEVFEGTKCSLLLTNNGRFDNLSSPSLPTEYIKAIDGITVSPKTGTCGRSAHLQEVVISPDLFEDPNWIPFKEIIKKYNLRSCTSYPIVNSSNITVATFAVYRNKIFTPGEKELQFSTQFTDLLSVISEMQKYKRKHEVLLNSIEDGFFSLNEKFEINYWNKTAENITGVEAEKALNRNLWDVFPKLESDVKQQFIELIKKNENASLTAYFPLFKKWFELIIYPKGEHLVSVFLRDVSERILREQQLIETKDRLEKVMNATNDAIYERDFSSTNIKWSKGYKDLFGHSLQNNETTTEEWFGLVHPDHQTNLERRFKQHLHEPDNTTWSAEYSYMRADESYALVMDRGSIIRDENGKAIKLIGAITDISHRKEYEESLKHLNKVLRNRAIELRQNNNELEQFAYLASHDLQEPLRTITNFIHQLERKYEDELDEKALQYIKFIVEGADRMRRLITDILEYSKLGKNKASNELVDVNKVVVELLQNMDNPIEESQAEIKFVELPVIEAKESHIYQIFSNLVSNAIKYRKNDVPPIIEIYHEESKNHYTFYVKDNGIGISPEFHEKIFDIFQRLHNSQNYSGTGIGLAMVKKSVDLLDGKIQVQSYDEGSIFVIQLPKNNN